MAKKQMIQPAPEQSLTTPRPRHRPARGTGEVFEIRQALSQREGKTISRREFAARVPCSPDTIERAELSGTMPKSKLLQAAIRALKEE